MAGVQSQCAGDGRPPLRIPWSPKMCYTRMLGLWPPYPLVLASDTRFPIRDAQLPAQASSTLPVPHPMELCTAHWGRMAYTSLSYRMPFPMCPPDHAGIRHRVAVPLQGPAARPAAPGSTGSAGQGANRRPDHLRHVNILHVHTHTRDYTRTSRARREQHRSGQRRRRCRWYGRRRRAATPAPAADGAARWRHTCGCRTRACGGASGEWRRSGR